MYYHHTLLNPTIDYICIHVLKSLFTPYLVHNSIYFYFQFAINKMKEYDGDIFRFRCFCILLKSHITKSFLWLCLFSVISHSLPSRHSIDNDHLSDYPYCGSMNYPKTSISRAVNAEKSDDWYRWLVFIERTNRLSVNELIKTFTCTGSVITER